MNSTQQKWEQKYAQATLNTPTQPCYALKQHSALLPFYGQALDLACGLGGNARFLAQCGLKVDAWDIADNALTILNNWANLHQLPITPLITDLDQMLLPYQKYDVIVISRYLNHALFTAIEQALKPDGLLIYQTFLAPVQVNAPKNPDYYVKSGELPQSFKKLQCLVYGEGWLNEATGQEQLTPAIASHRHRYSWFIGRKFNTSS